MLHWRVARCVCWHGSGGGDGFEKLSTFSFRWILLCIQYLVAMMSVFAILVDRQRIAEQMRREDFSTCIWNMYEVWTHTHHWCESARLKVSAHSICTGIRSKHSAWIPTEIVHLIANRCRHGENCSLNRIGFEFMAIDAWIQFICQKKKHNDCDEERVCGSTSFLIAASALTLTAQPIFSAYLFKMCVPHPCSQMSNLVKCTERFKCAFSRSKQTKGIW